MIYYVMDPTLCDLREWDAEHLEWEGTSLEDAVADAVLFWAKSGQELGDDTADLDGRVRSVIAATCADGSDAREYEVEIAVEISASLLDAGPVDVAAARVQACICPGGGAGGRRRDCPSHGDGFREST